MADVRAAGADDSDHMLRRIEIVVHHASPPRGRVVAAPAPPAEFSGWLPLLGILSGLLDAEPPAGVAGGRGGELVAGADTELGERVGDVGLDGAR